MRHTRIFRVLSFIDHFQNEKAFVKPTHVGLSVVGTAMLNARKGVSRGMWLLPKAAVIGGQPACPQLAGPGQCMPGQLARPRDYRGMYGVCYSRLQKFPQMPQPSARRVARLVATAPGFGLGIQKLEINTLKTNSVNLLWSRITPRATRSSTNCALRHMHGACFYTDNYDPPC